MRPVDLFHTRAFGLYALFAAGLSVLLLVIDASSGGFRVRSKTTLNKEDTGTTGAKLVVEDPEGVARVMRAHRNAIANILPFLVVMFLYVALGAPAEWVLGLSGVFTAMRVAHAVTYIVGIQPWRTVSFAIGQLCLGITIVQVIRAAIAFV